MRTQQPLDYDEMPYEQPPRRLEVPLALLSLALFLMLAFQTQQLWRERGALASATSSQDAPMQEAAKQRQQMEALAGATAQLADSGNAAAQQVVETMRRQGVSVKQPSK